MAFGSVSLRPIDIWAGCDEGSKILRTVELPAKASVHINMQQDFTQRDADLQSLRDQADGGGSARQRDAGQMGTVA